MRRATAGAVGVVGLSLVGTGIAAYLTAEYYAGSAPICGPTGGCAAVTSSSYATVAGVPVAVLGLAMYLALLGMGLLHLVRGTTLPTAPLLVATVSGLGVAFSAYLTALQLFIIHAICPWCVGSALTVLSILVISVAGMVNTRRRESQLALPS